MEIQIAIAGDLHCHHSSQQPAESLLISDLDRVPASQHPIESLLERIRVDALTADFLVAPGDLANRADRQGLISGWSFLQEVGNALGVKGIITTIGNHDVLLHETTVDAFQLAKRLRPLFPSPEQKQTDEFWANGFYILQQDDVRVLVLNSAASHTNKTLAKRGRITNQQIEQIGKALGNASSLFNIAVCHHHPILHEDIGLGTDDVMENGSLLTELLSERAFDLVIHGHKHHPKLSHAPSGPHPLPILAAGSLSAAMSRGLASRTRHLFHIVSLTKNKQGESSRGTIRSWQFRYFKGWSPATWSAAEFPGIAGFGCYKDPEALASEIRSAFKELNRSIADWSAVVSAVPDLRFVPPLTFKAVGAELQRDGYTLAPAPPDEPQFIGGPS